VLGGFVSTADRWELFADEWQAALDLTPKLDYFKMREAERLKDQFDPKRGWTEAKRDDRVIALTRIINKHAMFKVHIGVSGKHFTKHISSLPATERSLGTDTAYPLMLVRVIAAIAAMGPLKGLVGPCDFILDEESDGLEFEINERWSEIKDAARRHGRKENREMVGPRPIFRDDSDFLPLQAADLYVGAARRSYIQNRVLWAPPPKALRALSRIPGYEHFVDEGELLLRRARLEAEGKEILSRSPDLNLRHYGDDPKASPQRVRKKNRAKAKKNAQKGGKG